MATQVTLFPFTGLPAPAGGEPTNHDNNGVGPVRVVIQDPGVDLAKKTVCIKMRLSTMGNTRKVSTSQIEADADKDLLRVSKHLLDSAELKAMGPLSTVRFAGSSTTSACPSKSAFTCCLSQRSKLSRTACKGSPRTAKLW